MDNNIISRAEAYLQYAQNLRSDYPEPISRLDFYLLSTAQEVRLGGADPQTIIDAVNDYLTANPPQTMTDTQIADSVNRSITSGDIVVGSSLTTDQETNIAKIPDMNTDISTLQNDLSNIQTEVTTVKTDIDSLEIDVDSLENDLVNIQTEVSTVKTDIDNLEADIDNLEADVNTDISKLQTDLVNIQSEVTTVKTDIDNLEADIDSLENKEIDTITYADNKLTLTHKDGTAKEVTIQHKLVNLADVDITSPNSGDVVTYSASTGKFTTGQVSSTDQYVKMTATDSNAGYLADLIDDDTIKNNNGKLEVEKIKGQTISVDELNTLLGMDTNVKDTLNALSSGGMVFKDVVGTYADLPNSAVNGFVYIVNTDETDNGNRNAYIYSDDHAGFVLVGTSGLEVRDFTTNPIDLTSEVINILPKDKMETTDLVDKTKDIINTLSYPIPDEDLEKIPNLKVLKQINTEVIDALNGKMNNTDIVDNLTDNSVDKPLSANQGKVLDGKIEHKIDNDKIVTTLDSTATDEQVPSAKAMVDELNTKANDDEVVKKTDITTTIDNTSTNTQVPSAKSVYDFITNELNGEVLTTGDIFEWAKDKKTNSNCFCESVVTNLPVQADGSVILNYIGGGIKTMLFISHSGVYSSHFNTVKWSGWKRVCTTSVDDVKETSIKFDKTALGLTISNSRSSYKVINGICYVTIELHVDAPSDYKTYGYVRINTTSLPKIGFATKAVLNVVEANSSISAVLDKGSTDIKLHGNVLPKEGTYVIQGSFSYPVAES